MFPVITNQELELKDWERILKNWYDLGYKLKFVISGSSSIWISKGTEESLLGRIKTSIMMPLKFSEVLRYREIPPPDPEQPGSPGFRGHG